MRDHTHGLFATLAGQCARPICLPTYNELENLEPMVRALAEVAARGRPRPRRRRRLARRHRRARRRARRRASASSTSSTGRARRGSGPAYIAGFRRALADGAELVLEMDCDFSHDPADVPTPDRGRRGRRRPRARLALRRRAARSRTGAPPGGSSRSAGTSTRRSCSASRLRDLTGGFKCFRARVLETIDLDAIGSKGYAFQIETTYRVAPGRVQGRRGADLVLRPRARPLEDEQGDRRSRRSGRCRCCGFARSRAVCSLESMRDVTDASFEPDVLAGGAPGRRRLLGALVRALQGGHEGARGARRRDRPDRVREARHRREPGRRVALRRALDPDGDPLRRRRAERDRDRRPPGGPFPPGLREVPV